MMYDHPLQSFCRIIDFNGCQRSGEFQLGALSPGPDRLAHYERHRDRVRVFNVHRQIRQAVLAAAFEHIDFMNWLLGD